jgi:integrase
VKNLRRRNIDFTNKEVRIDDSKNDEGRVFPMTDALEEMLRTIVPKHGFPDDLVFTYTVRTRDGQPVISRVRRKDPQTGEWVLHTLPAVRPVGDFGKAFATACYKAGLPCKTEPWSYVNPKNGATVTGIRVLKGSHTPHDFRRTAVRNLTNMGVPEKVAMEMCGHRTRAVFDRYRIVSKADLNTAAAKLNQAHAHLAKAGTTASAAGTVAGTVGRFGKAK